VKVAGPVAVRGLEGLELGPREGSKLGHHLPVEAGRQVGHAHSRLSQAAQRRLIRLLLGAGTSRHLYGSCETVLGNRNDLLRLRFQTKFRSFSKKFVQNLAFSMFEATLFPKKVF